MFLRKPFGIIYFDPMATPQKIDLITLVLGPSLEAFLHAYAMVFEMRVLAVPMVPKLTNGWQLVRLNHRHANTALFRRNSIMISIHTIERMSTICGRILPGGKKTKIQCSLEPFNYCSQILLVWDAPKEAVLFLGVTSQ